MAGGPVTVRVVSHLSYIDFAYHRYTSAVFDNKAGASSSVRLQLTEKVVCNMRDLLGAKCTHHEAVDFVLDPRLPCSWRSLTRMARARNGCCA